MRSPRRLLRIIRASVITNVLYLFFFCFSFRSRVFRKEKSFFFFVSCSFPHALGVENIIAVITTMPVRRGAFRDGLSKNDKWIFRSKLHTVTIRFYVRCAAPRKINERSLSTRFLKLKIYQRNFYQTSNTTVRTRKQKKIYRNEHRDIIFIDCIACGRKYELFYA